MTATATPPRALAPPPAPPRTRPASDQRASRGRSATPPHLAGAELALALVSVAVVYGFSRVFSDWAWFWPLLAIGAYGHLVTMTLRRRGVGVLPAAVVTFIGWCVLATWLWFSSTTVVLLPSGATWRAADAALHESWSSFQELAAPVPSSTGFVLAAGFGLLFAIFLADWAAFRLWSAVEAIVPSLTLFVFCALLAAERQRVASAMLFAVAVLLFVLVHRVAKLELSSGWLTSDIERGSGWLLRTGVLLAVVAVVAGVVVGPQLPGANDDPLFDWRTGDNGPSSRVTISPLVEIRKRLVNQSARTVFTVHSAQPSYWRMTSLDTFDGNIWRSGGKYTEADGSLGTAVPARLPSDRVEQTFDISSLEALWLPAAFQPVEVHPDGESVRYQADSSTLIVDTNYRSSDSFTYRVVSDIPHPTREQLDAPTGPVPEAYQQYLELPGDFSTRARSLASEVQRTTGAVTPYERAVALQDFFRNEGPFASADEPFLYDLEHTQEGHSDQAIDQFLTDRRGYCEQFAGTYAAMARSIGLPARVAVGFTWGDQDPSDPTLYTVKGKHAHAWPEVWLGPEVGWIAFEPTPGRAAPSMTGYTDLVPAQDTGPGASTTTTAPGGTATTSTPPSATDPGSVDLSGLLSQNETGSAASTSSDSWLTTATSSWLARGGALLLALAVFCYAVAVPIALTVRRRGRRERANDPDSRVQVAWQEALEDLSLVGLRRAPAETHDEFAERLAPELPSHATALRQLAVDTDAATYAPGILDDHVAARAQQTAEQIATTVHERVPRRRRWLRRFDPRPLFRQRSGSPRKEARTAVR